MTVLYLICFVLGLTLSVLAVFGGGARLHLGHIHLGHVHTGHTHVGPAGAHGKIGSNPISALNGFTLPAFLGWFGGAGYLLRTHTGLLMPFVLLLALLSGLAGASLLYLFLFRLLLPMERVLNPEDTRMDGVLARVSDAIRADGGTGEILFTQLNARRSAAARSENGAPIPRGTEVVVLRYTSGIAYVSPIGESSP